MKISIEISPSRSELVINVGSFATYNNLTDSVQMGIHALLLFL